MSAQTLFDAPEPPPISAHGGELTWTDLFCGAGGSSLGIHHVPGQRVRYAINHWDLAIQAHQANFPDTDHEVSLIETVHPSRFNRTDCAWFSPSCTSHAYCGPRGNDDESVRSRATMWDAVRWIEWHRYDAAIVENVIEAKLWCDAPGHYEAAARAGKKGCSCGVTFDDWKAQIEALGYESREVYFNSQHAYAPQSRDRMYVVFWRRGITPPNLDFQPLSYCTECQQVVSAVQTWKPATRSGARARARTFEWGKFGVNYTYNCPRCQAVAAPGVIGSHAIIDHTLPIDTIGSRKRPIAPATRRRIRVGLQKVGAHKSVQLAVGGNLYERPGYARLWSLDDPLRTVTTTPYLAVILRYGGQAAAPRGLREPTMGLTAHDRQIGLITPAGSRDATPRSTEEPSHALTTSERLAVVVPNRTNATGQGMHEPTATVTTGGNHMLVTMRRNATGRSTAEPAPTLAAGGTHHAIVYNGSPGHVRDHDMPSGTVKTRDSQAVIYPYRTGNVPARTHQPTPTVDTRATAALLDLTDQDIDDMLFRMLHWQELQRAQAMHALPDGSPYQLTARVPARGGKFKELTNEQRVKMIGNAVSSPVATMLALAVSDALATA